MLSKWQWALSQIGRTLWVRATLFAIVAIAVALIAIPAQNLLGDHRTLEIGADAVGNILNILASSMLAVTTFSLGVIISAYGSASSGVTPRATQLVRQDTATQNVLATFLGSFLFSLVGIIALSTGLYGEGGRFLLFIATLVVILLIVITMIRWIQHLSGLGRLESTTQRVEHVTIQALEDRIAYPQLGARALFDPDDIPKSAQRICSHDIGYIQYINLAALSDFAESLEIELNIVKMPGHFVHPADPLIWLESELDEAQITKCQNAFTIKPVRSFEQDPRFGLSVLAEIACRALPPANNDPATAIDIIGRAVRVLSHWKEIQLTDEQESVIYPRLSMISLSIEDLFDDVFLPISRDAASMIEVQTRLFKGLLALSQQSPDIFAKEALRSAQIALQYSERHLVIDAHYQHLISLTEQIKQLIRP